MALGWALGFSVYKHAVVELWLFAQEFNPVG